MAIEIVEHFYPVWEEEWRPIPNLPGYEASSLGRIRSLDRLRPLPNRWRQVVSRRHRGRIIQLKAKPNGCGGFYDFFYSDGNKTIQVNRAVCAAFTGLPPTPRHEAAHLNGDSRDNRSANLTWATALENASHKQMHGTAANGSKNGMSRLRETDIPQIFSQYVAGVPAETIAGMFGVTRENIILIVGRRSWRHVLIEDITIERARVMAQTNILKARNDSNSARRADALARRQNRAVGHKAPNTIRPQQSPPLSGAD